MAFQLPRRFARFNRVVTNPVQSRYAWLVPPWVVVVHRGRRSGRLYRTPVMGFLSGSTLSMVILYGEQSDWVLNVLAGGAEVVRAGRTHQLLKPRIVGPREGGGVTPAARLLGRLSGRVLVAQFGERRPGFGRGPRT